MRLVFIAARVKFMLVDLKRYCEKMISMDDAAPRHTMADEQTRQVQTSSLQSLTCVFVTCRMCDKSLFRYSMTSLSRPESSMWLMYIGKANATAGAYVG